MAKSTSLWRATTTPTERPSLDADVTTDVCVIGAGIAGLTAAYLLAREGRGVLVIDAQDVGGGQTAMTTAHLSNEIDATYAELVRLHGVDRARLACDSHRAAIDAIEAICAEEAVECAFERVDGFLFVADGDDERALDAELEAARAAGADVTRLPDAGVAGFRSGPCLRFARQAQFHPLLYLEGLARAIERRGGRIYPRTRAISVQGGDAASVRTASGQTIGAGAIVVATNSPFNDIVAIHTKQAPYHTYAIGASVPPHTIAHALYWDTADPFHYVRLARATERPLGGDTDEAVDVLIVGGEDHKAAQASDAADRFARLEQWMRRHFPDAGEVRCRWSGQVMETMDGLAFIGRNPMDQPNVYIATGDSGMGLTHGTIAGMVIRDGILRRDNPWAPLYDPSRARTGAAFHWLKENVNVALQYASWLTPGDVDSIEKIPPGSGAVVVAKGLKVAVYRDEQGELHARSAVCPHLGCIVAWNAAAATWDCPCHGSRFDKLGNVINGPAAKDLDPAG